MDPTAASSRVKPTVGGRRVVVGKTQHPNQEISSPTSSSSSSSSGGGSRKGRPSQPLAQLSTVHYLPEDEAITIRYPNLYGDPDTSLGSPEFSTPLVHFPPPPDYPPPTSARPRQQQVQMALMRGGGNHFQQQQYNANNPVIINGNNPCANNDNNSGISMANMTENMTVRSGGKGNPSRMMTTGRLQNPFALPEGVKGGHQGVGGQSSKTLGMKSKKSANGTNVSCPSQQTSKGSSSKPMMVMISPRSDDHLSSCKNYTNNNNNTSQITNNSRNCSGTNSSSSNSSSVLMSGGGGGNCCRNNGIMNDASGFPNGETAAAQAAGVGDCAEDKHPNDITANNATVTGNNSNNNEPQVNIN